MHFLDKSDDMPKLISILSVRLLLQAVMFAFPFQQLHRLLHFTQANDCLYATIPMYMLTQSSNANNMYNRHNADVNQSWTPALATIAP